MALQKYEMSIGKQNGADFFSFKNIYKVLVTKSITFLYKKHLYGFCLQTSKQNNKNNIF